MKKLGDLLYRFLLWFSVSVFLHYLLSFSDGKQGRLLAEALRSPPNVIYGEVLTGFAAVLFVLTLIMFDVHRVVKRVGFIGSAIRSASLWSSRIASDLLLSAYGMASFLLGWVSYEWFAGNNVYTENTTRLLLGFGILDFSAMLIALGAMSMIVRIAPRARWLKSWYKVRAWLRGYAYASAFLAIAILYWF